MHRTLRTLCILAAALALAACGKAPETVRPAAGSAPATAIAWIKPQTVAEVDRAFEQAKAQNQPVFLFWTAVWCPPCNQVKSAIFTRPEFIQKSRAFIPVYVDADSPSGQMLGERFKVRGYPTMVLLDGSGQELTRLAGSVDAAKYMQLLDRGLAGGNTAQQALAAALAGKPLPSEDWHMLAFYSWGTDDGRLVPEKDAPATLLKLAAACPPQEREASSRLVLEALLAGAQAKDKPRLDRADALASVQSLLAQPALVRDNNDILGYGADDIAGLITAPKSRERADLVAQWSAALDRLLADKAVGAAGRLYALVGKVGLARLDDPKATLPAALVTQVRAEVERVNRDTTDLDQRQALITLSGSLLAEAGLLDESDALLKAEIPRAHSPYFYMSQLASNARKRGTPEGRAAAVDWSAQAYAAAQGSATRLRWGGGYVNTLLEQTPQDAAAIEKAAAQVLGELKGGVALTGNNRAALERLSKRLTAWNKDGKHDDVLARLAEQMKPLCAGAPATDAAWCDGLFAPGKRA